MPRPRAYLSDAELLARREARRARHRERSFLSRHRIELEECKRLYEIYGRVLETSDDPYEKSVITAQRGALLSQIAVHTRALETHERIRPVERAYVPTPQEMYYVSQEGKHAQATSRVNQKVSIQEFEDKLRREGVDMRQVEQDAESDPEIKRLSEEVAKQLKEADLRVLAEQAAAKMKTVTKEISFTLEERSQWVTPEEVERILGLNPDYNPEED